MIGSFHPKASIFRCGLLNANQLLNMGVLLRFSDLAMNTIPSRVCSYFASILKLVLECIVLHLPLTHVPVRVAVEWFQCMFILSVIHSWLAIKEAVIHISIRVTMRRLLNCAVKDNSNVQGEARGRDRGRRQGRGWGWQLPADWLESDLLVGYYTSR